MPKREATTELTDRNWDQEDEPEEAGTFQKAGDEDIEKRVIKKARRRGIAGSEGSSGSAFSGFKGFSGFGTAKSTSAPTSSMFTLGASKPNGDDGKSGGSVSFGFNQKPQSTTLTAFKSSSNIPTETKPSTNGNHTTSYSTQLQSLNKCVLDWIKKHIDTNPVCDLTPIFEDYKKHILEIEKNAKLESELRKTESLSAEHKSEPAPSQTGFSGFSFKSTNSETVTKDSGFQFSTSKETNSGGGLFGKPATTAPGTSSIFGLGKATAETKPFSFGGASTQEEEYEPPKVEVKEIKEKDALYTIRCKLFYKSDDAFKDKGVGNLHLKKSGTVAQLLVRADTNLGNIILNIGLPPNLPIQRQGKNNVMMIIPPNPPVSDKCPQCNKKYANPQSSNICETGCVAQPVPLLFRVKTAGDADKLLEEIKAIIK